MEPVLLITKADFAPYVELSANLDAVKKLNTHIEHAQEFDLRPLLGDLLYYDFLNKMKSYQEGKEAETEEEPYTPTAQEQLYLNLLNGKEYTVSEVSISFKGIVPVLVHFTTARLIPNLNGMITAHGFNTKRNDLSDPVDPKEISRAATSYESLALGYWQKVKSFLDTNASDYILWDKATCNNYSGTSRKSGARIYGLN